MIILIGNTYECPLRDHHRTPPYCNISKCECEYGAYVPNCPLLDDMVTVVRKKNGDRQLCVCKSHYDRTGEHVEDCPCFTEDEVSK